MFCPYPTTCPYNDTKKTGVPFCVLPVCVRKHPDKASKELPKIFLSSAGEET